MGNIPKRVLVVDDDPLTREYITEIVEALGYRVSSAGDGERALNSMVSCGRVDAVITDYHMPVMDGRELTRRVKRSSSRTKVIFVSAARVDEFRAIAEEAGADEALDKSDIAQRLPAILDDLIGSPRPFGYIPG